MATNPDPHPDSPNPGPSEAPDQITPIEEPGRESIEGVTPDEESGLKGSDQILAFENSLPDYFKDSGLPSGVAGTAGENKVQDEPTS
jgi:hypothetical protein